MIVQVNVKSQLELFAVVDTDNHIGLSASVYSGSGEKRQSQSLVAKDETGRDGRVPGRLKAPSKKASQVRIVLKDEFQLARMGVARAPAQGARRSIFQLEP